MLSMQARFGSDAWVHAFLWEPGVAGVAGMGFVRRVSWRTMWHDGSCGAWLAPPQEAVRLLLVCEP